MVNKGLQNEGLCSTLAVVGQIKQSGYSCFTWDISVYTVSAEGCGPPCLVVSYNKPRILRTYSKPDPHRIALVELFCFVGFFFQYYAFIISPSLKIKCFMTIGFISLFTRENVFPQFFNLSCAELLPSSA